MSEKEPTWYQIDNVVTKKSEKKNSMFAELFGSGSLQEHTFISILVIYTEVQTKLPFEDLLGSKTSPVNFLSICRK